MIRVTWEWLGQGPALDLADTVTITAGEESDLLAAPGEYERWARAHVDALGWPDEHYDVLVSAPAEVLDLRKSIRAVIGALADGSAVPEAAIAQLNRTSREAPQWLELGETGLTTRTRAGRQAELLARYARDALTWAAGESGSLRRCPAPSCGMFYPPCRPQQRWCSTVCGSRARVARHYRARQRA